MQVEQYVMAYGIEQDRIRAIIPEGFVSLRPVLRINAEIQDNSNGYLEFNTPVEKDGNRGWLNIGYWNEVQFQKEGRTTTFQTDFIEISFTGVGIEGSCPAEKDNAGCYFLKETPELKKPETITENKEFCDCTFQWKFTEKDAHGVSIGKTLPAYPQEPETTYPRDTFTAKMQQKFHADRCWEHIKLFLKDSKVKITKKQS